ncbi:hypothetical protein OJ997_17700 [Solirubrobacter phytolaccae]|uniref:Uncharacterized protein n=1 Tax=Solirubrobacter phytolaccae TaxID=1404360 RepID=A0A9X3NC71_9ACTN|nr:hypothetical protein [Solirubrobacter phytolaccae]MDA0182145.1 hypothetical protein [Solirubrobacter phytolaccae]
MDGLRPPLWLRLVAAALVLAASFVAALASFWLLVLGSLGLGSLVASLLACGVASLLALAAWPMLSGRWARGALVALQRLAVAVAVGGYAVLGLFSAEQVRAGLMQRDVHATPSDELGFWTVLALFGVVATVVVLVALPVELTRRLRMGVIGLLAASVLLGTGAAVAIAASGDPCDGFRFDRAAWRAKDTRERVGEALVRCRTLHGMHRDDVDELLGGQFVNSRQRGYTLRVSENALGWPIYRTLVVGYGDDKRVRSVSLSQSDD